MWKPILFSIIFLLGCLLFINITESKNREKIAYEHAKEFVQTKYNEASDLSNAGIRYDVGRNNYAVILEDQNQIRYYIEVKLGQDQNVISINDETSTIKLAN
ncbi:hypothetical protein [Paenisporosarcina cavernae]|uniref:PepSY domain-containing protein n=1 Tax=Paenisporosarcina cavernae TaxID=2320858 RepID=A0A385YTU7_9BACL|nr:hypothetical protein [Paenisporosarcina cavernae]AYC30086.1 hypothetical protein D3873_09450 [Paenisporosarcina cavernae]